MKHKIFLITALILLFYIIPVSAEIKVTDAQCYEDGSFKIEIMANSEDVIYMSDIILSAENRKVKGAWNNDRIWLTDSAANKYATFTGIEDQLILAEPYTIKIDYKMTKEDLTKIPKTETFELECPGLLFTCNRLSLNLKSCETSEGGKFTAQIEVMGLEQSERRKLDPVKVIDYILDADQYYKDITGRTGKRGSLPQGYTIERIKDYTYKISYSFIDGNFIKDMWVKFNDNLPKQCNPSDYPQLQFSSKKECKHGVVTEEEILEEMDIEKIREKYKEQITEKKEEQKEEPTQNPAGYSIKDAEITSQAGKKSQLKLLGLILLGVIIVGGSAVFYFYKQGVL